MVPSLPSDVILVFLEGVYLSQETYVFLYFVVLCSAGDLFTPRTPNIYGGGGDVSGDLDHKSTILLLPLASTILH